MTVTASVAVERARRAEARRLDARILDAVRRGWNEPLCEAEFDELARALFLHQRRHNPVAGAWWDAAGIVDDAVRGWRDVPPLPVSAYRHARVAAFPPRPAGDRPRFLSSGTTAAARSRVHAERLDLYEAALLPPFRRHALGDLERMRLLFLSPPPERARRSSLVHMFGILRRACGTADSAFLGAGDGLDAAALASALREAETEGEPVFLLGPAFAFVHALDELRAGGARFRAPSGSRLFQTGGFKGRSRAISSNELLGGYETTFGIPPERVINEYGMAELASQFYAGAAGLYAGPPWVRWRVLDPGSLLPAGDGVPGALAVWDLANRSSCLALRTEDLAVARDGGFELLGRLSGSEPKGCSLEADRVRSSSADRASTGAR
jgi:hypothetical protein